MMKLYVHCGTGELETMYLPAPMEQIHEQVRIMNERCPKGDVPAICTVKTPVKGISAQLHGVELNSEPTLHKLNDLAKRVEEMDAAGHYALAKAMHTIFKQDLDEILDIVKHLDPEDICQYEVIPKVSTDDELGKWLIGNDWLEEKIPEFIRPYLQYRSIGEDYREWHDGFFLEKAYVGKKEKQPEATMDEMATIRVTLVAADSKLLLNLPVSDLQLEVQKNRLNLTDFSQADIRLTGLPSSYLEDVLPQAAVTVEDANQLARCFQQMWRKDFRLIKYCSALAAEQPDTFAEALVIAQNIDDYEYMGRSIYEYGRDVAERLELEEMEEMEEIGGMDGWELEKLGANYMAEEGVLQTEFGLIRRRSEPFPAPESKMEETDFGQACQLGGMC